MPGIWSKYVINVITNPCKIFSTAHSKISLFWISRATLCQTAACEPRYFPFFTQIEDSNRSEILRYPAADILNIHGIKEPNRWPLKIHPAYFSQGEWSVMVLIIGRGLHIIQLHVSNLKNIDISVIPKRLSFYTN